MFGRLDKPGAAPLDVLDSFRLQARRKTAQATSERKAFRDRVFDVNIGSNELGKYSTRLARISGYNFDQGVKRPAG